MEWLTCPFNYNAFLGCNEDDAYRGLDKDGNMTCSMDGRIITPQDCLACVDSALAKQDGVKEGRM
jgi:hypothetical protein